MRVKDVLDLLAAGADREEVLAEYPCLESEDITATLEFAAQQSDHPVLRSAWHGLCARASCDPRVVSA